MDMSILAQNVSIVNGQFTLSANTLPELSLQPLLSAYNGDQPFIIDNAQKTITENAVTVTGTLSFMRVQMLAVEVIFLVDETGAPVVTLRFSLIGSVPAPNAWRFSTSFPDLPFFLDYNTSTVIPQLDLLDKLQLSDAFFVLTTRAGKDQATGVPLAVGLNFIGTLNLTGFAELFETLLSDHAPVTLYGTITMPLLNQVTPPLPRQIYPWQVQWSVPGVQLQANLGIETMFSSLKYDNLLLRIYSPLSNEWLIANNSYQTTQAVTGTLQIASANLTVDTVVELTSGYPSASIVALFSNATLDNLAQLADLANGKDLFDALPDDVKSALAKTGNLSLERASINLTGGISITSVTSLSFTVGMANLQWVVFPGITVSSISADFIIDSPFAAGRSVTVLPGGSLSIGETLLDVTAEFPDFTLWAELQDEATLPLQALFQQYLPELPVPPNLVMGEVLLLITPGQEYSFTAMQADEPAWTLQLGSNSLTIDDVRVQIFKQASGSLQATFDGRLQLAQDLILAVNYSLPGDFFIRADLPTINLSSLIRLFDESGFTPPESFDITLTQSYVLIERDTFGERFSVASSIPNLGLLAFTVQYQGAWGFALGVDLSLTSFAALPGLGSLAAFDSFVGLQKVLLVLTSLSQPTGFLFPDFAHFNAPSLGNTSIQLPAQASGLVRGLNLYAQLGAVKSRDLLALTKYLRIQLDGSVGITLALSLPDPVTNSRLFLSVNEEIQQGITLIGELGGLLQGSDVGVFVTAVVKTQVQSQPLEFSVTAAVLDGGILISGAYQGTITFEAVQLSNLALIIGLDFEGVPSLGIAATLDIEHFETALAIFFDSTDPAKSLVAGAISNVTLLDIVEHIAGVQNVPAELNATLGFVRLNALSAFTMPATVATSLDNRDLGAIAGAFKQYGNVSMPASSDRILLVIATKNALWHLTDLSTMQHYSLALQGSIIAVSLQPQFYLAPQVTFIGSLQYPQGFSLTAEIDYLLIQTQIKILVNMQQGIAADVDLAPIVLLSSDFFSLTGANGQGGPHLSLATYSQPALNDVSLRAPHFLLSGDIHLLGVVVEDVLVLINERGLTFSINDQVNPLLHMDLSGTFASLTDIAVHGTIIVRINRWLDLGVLGTLQVNVSVSGILAVIYTGENLSVTFQGSFTFQGIQCNIPLLVLDGRSPALQQIDDILWIQIQDIISGLLKDADQWLLWLKSGAIQGVGQSANQVGQILSSVYHLPANDIASKTKHILGYSVTNVTLALKGTGATANQVASALKSAGYQMIDISSAITAIFSKTHADINVGHLNSPAGSHTGTPTSQSDAAATHTDSTSHEDVPRSHDLPGGSD